MCLLLHSKAGRVRWRIVQIPMTALRPPRQESACNLIHRHSLPSRLLLTHRRRPSSTSKFQCPPCTLWRCIFVIHHTAFRIRAPPPATRRRILLRQRQFQLYNAARETAFPFGWGMRQRIQTHQQRRSEQLRRRRCYHAASLRCWMATRFCRVWMSH